MIRQETVDLEGVEIPVILLDNIYYYPISFIEKHVLLRKKGALKSGLNKESIIRVEIDFDKWRKGNISETDCVSVNGLKDRLQRTQSRRLSKEQIISQNKLHRHLNIDELDIGEYEWDMYKLEWSEEFDVYTRGLIERLIANEKEIRARRCKDCNKILPLMDNFYHRESSNKELFSNSCIICRGTSFYISDDVYESYLLTQDTSLIRAYRDSDIIPLYNSYRLRYLKKLPKDFYTKENAIKILFYLKDSDKLDKHNLNARTLRNEFRIDIMKYKITMTEIYQSLYGKYFYLDKWKYPKYTFAGDIELTEDLAVEIFNRYLKAHSIIIENPFLFDYQSVIDACNLRGALSKHFGGLGGFFVFYWKGKYAGYHFRSLGNFYSSNDNNMLSDLKFLVEKDMKLEIEKIPLYITKGFLYRDYKNIYNFMRNDGRSLFYWFDILYPDKFIESDFTIGRYRNEFDSIEEQQVDDVLREYFSNVIYNYNTSDQVVELKGKRPDWFIMTEKGVWIVEYFGMYIEKQSYNPIIASYIETTHEKLKLYDEMEGYNFLLVYPSDTEKGFLGLRDKLEKLREEVR